jgi:hypothetical protein
MNTDKVTAFNLMAEKMAEMVMQAQMVRDGIGHAPSAMMQVVDIGRTTLARVGRPMPLAPARTALPRGIDPRTGKPTDDLTVPPGEAEVADVTHHHLQPDKVKLP